MSAALFRIIRPACGAELPLSVAYGWLVTMEVNVFLSFRHAWVLSSFSFSVHLLWLYFLSLSVFLFLGVSAQNNSNDHASMSVSRPSLNPWGGRVRNDKRKSACWCDVLACCADDPCDRCFSSTDEMSTQALKPLDITGVTGDLTEGQVCRVFHLVLLRLCFIQMKNTIIVNAIHIWSSRNQTLHSFGLLYMAPYMTAASSADASLCLKHKTW